MMETESPDAAEKLQIETLRPPRQGELRLRKREHPGVTLR